MTQFENTAHPLSYFINPMRTPTIDFVKDENPMWIGSEHISKNKIHVAICLLSAELCVELCAAAAGTPAAKRVQEQDV